MEWNEWAGENHCFSNSICNNYQSSIICEPSEKEMTFQFIFNKIFFECNLTNF